MSKILKIQTPKEEFVNATTHGIAFCAALTFIPFLLYRAFSSGDFYMFLSCTIYSIGMFMTFLSSTMYHSSKRLSRRKRWKVMDHISIYLMIGGTYVPVVYRFLPKEEAILFLVIIWSIILIGSILKIFYTGRYEILSTIFYIILGHLILIEIGWVIKLMPFEILRLIILGGIAYSIGVYFYIGIKKMYAHAIWHIFVIIGAIFHAIAIYKIV